MNKDYKIIYGDCCEQLRNFKDNYFDLAIADPPYFKVVNERWDYQWRIEDDYINWCNQWLSQIYRTLRYGGTLYLFGYFKILSLLIPNLFELGFSFRQQIILNKGIKAVAGRATKNYKMFPNVTESILFLVKDNIQFSRKLLKKRQKELGLSSKKINNQLGVKANGGGMWSIYTGDNVCEQFPTEGLWSELQNILEFNYPYNRIAQTFNPEMGITDVWNDINFCEKNRIHPTQKPLKLIQRLIKVSSNKGDKILDPFGGSGTTLIAANHLGRKCVIIEKEIEYIDKIKNRIKIDKGLLSRGK